MTTPQHVDRGGAVETNIEVNAEALRRASLRNGGTAPTESARDRDIAIAAGIERSDSAQDAVLNWGGGVSRSTVGRSDLPLTPRLSEVAGVTAENIDSRDSMDPFRDHTGGRK
jgi:hypothetical protein